MTKFPLRELPKYETIREMSERYSEIDPSAVEAFLVMLSSVSEVLDNAGDRLTRNGLSSGRFMVLMMLNCAPDVPQNPSLLAERAKVSRATITGLVDGLVKDGLVKRSSDPNNRREVRLQLTAKGKTFLDGYCPGHFQCIAQLMKPLSERERKQLIKLMIKVKNGAEVFLNQ